MKLWDARDASRAAGMTLDHGAPVEDIAWFPTGSLLVSVGGQDVCVWDVLGGGRLLQFFGVTRRPSCAATSRRRRPAARVRRRRPRRRVRATRRDEQSRAETSHRVVGRARQGARARRVHGDALGEIPGTVLSVALSPANLLAVGTANKLLSLRKRNKPRESRADAVPLGEGRGYVRVGGYTSWRRRSSKRRPRRLDAGSYHYFIRGTDAKAAEEGDARILRRRRARLAAHDHALRRFRYGEALDAALAGGRAEVVAAVLEEILMRGGLRTALSGRDAAALAPVLKFAARHVSNRDTRQLVGVVSRVIDIYGGEGWRVARRGRRASKRARTRRETTQGTGRVGEVERGRRAVVGGGTTRGVRRRRRNLGAREKRRA